MLSEARLRVLRLAALGLDNSEIAFALGVSVETVKTHMRVGLRELGARNRPEAIHICHQRGLFAERKEAV